MVIMAKEETEQEGGNDAGIVAGIKSAYYWTEDTFYYPVVDGLASMGVPIYPWFVDPIENRGLPSFPFALFIVIAILAALLLLLLTPQTATVSVNLLSETGSPVGSASVRMFLDYEADGNLLGQAESDATGTVVFAKIPLGKPIWLKAVAQGYEEYSNPIAPFAADSVSQTVFLSPIGTASGKRVGVNVYVVNSDSEPVEDAKITAALFNGSASGAGSYSTNASGIARLQVASGDSVYLNVSKEGFIPVSGKRISAADAPAVTIMLYRGSLQFAKAATVIVKVMNLSGHAVDSRVTLSTISGGLLTYADTTEGAARLEIPQGTRYVCGVVATGADAARYAEYSSGQLSADLEENRVDAVLNAASNPSRIYVAVESEAGTKLDANVSLYEEGTNYFVAHKRTVSGEAYFDGLDSFKKYYATGYAVGYYPEVVRNLSLGSHATLVFMQVIVPDNSSVRATVYESNRKTVVYQAAVYVTTADGAFLGYPAALTGADGVASIPNVKPESKLKLYAEKPPRKGISDQFSTAKGRTSDVAVYLEPGPAFVVVRAFDSKTNLSLAATASATTSGVSLSACSLQAVAGSSCALEIYADMAAVVNVTSTGYLAASATFTVPMLSRVSYNASMDLIAAPTATPSPSATPTPLCLAAGASCAANSSCCNANCVGGTCATGQCNKYLPIGHNGCPMETPICGDDLICRGCNSSKQCPDELPYCMITPPQATGTCGCDATRDPNGCPAEAPFCTAQHKCAACTPENALQVCGLGAMCVDGQCKLSCTVDSDCGSGMVCRENRCGLGCRTDAECGQGLVCDKQEKVCYAPPSSVLVEYRIPTLGTTDSSGAKVFYYNKTPISSFALNISAILPVSGFVLRLSNLDAEQRQVTFESNPFFGIYFVNGTKPHSYIRVPADSNLDLIVSYPDMDPSVFDGTRWGDAAGYWAAGDGTVKFNASATSLVVLGANFANHSLQIIPAVSDLGKYAATAGLIETSRDSLVGLDPANTSNYDALFTGEPFGKSLSYLVSDNILLSNASYKFAFGPSVSALSENLLKPGIEFASVPANSSTIPSELWAAPVYASSTKYSRTFKVSPSALNLRPNASASHLASSTAVNLALYNLASLNYTLQQEGVTNQGKDVDLFGILRLGSGAFKSDGSGGRLSDLFVFGREGLTQRLLWFEYVPSRMLFKYPRDATAQLEYSDLEGEIAGTSKPYQKYLLAYPGQKDNFAYFCPTTSACSSPGSSLYVRGNKGDFYSADSSVYGAVRTLKAGPCQDVGACSGPLYCNPATKILEENAQACCASKVSRNGKCIVAGSNDACVLTQSGQWYYALSATSRATSASGCGSNADCKNCFGHGCDAASCEASDYNGGARANGFDPYALLNPDKRCFTYSYVTNPCIDTCGCSCPPTVVTACTACSSGCSYEYAVGKFPLCTAAPACSKLRAICVGNPPVEDFFPVCSAQSSCSVKKA